MSPQDSNANEQAALPSSGGNGNEDFIDPPMVESVEGSSDSDEFEPPSAELFGAENLTDIESDPEGQEVLSAKAEIEQKLAEAATSSLTEASGRILDGPGVLGVGLSTGGESGGIPGQPALVVYVENQADEEQVRREIVDSMGIQAVSSDNLPVEIEVTGVIEAYSSNRSKFRPAPAGVSVGHYNITAGTIGGWARGRGTRSNRLLMVSNNHVLANSNRGRFGDSIIQPGRADGGINTRDRIAILERFVTINFGSGGINYVDCATGWCWPTRVRRDHVYHTGSTPRYFKVGSALASPRLNMVVGKTGRTTNLTQGLIRAVGVSVNVNFGSAGVAHFRDQFSVRSTGRGTFSAGGDSGAFVWGWQRGLPPVGLLFAGGGGTTFCNRMSRVVSALDITLS